MRTLPSAFVMIPMKIAISMTTPITTMMVMMR